MSGKLIGVEQFTKLQKNKVKLLVAGGSEHFRPQHPKSPRVEGSSAASSKDSFITAR